MNVPDINSDVLLVNLWDEDIKNDDRMMNEQEIPLASVPIGTRQVFNEGVSLKNKDAGRIHYEYILDDGLTAQERSVTVEQPCKVIVHAIKGEKLRKQDTPSTDPYLTMQLSGEPDSLKQTKTINKDLNPVWNQKFELHSKDWNSDALVVNMMNQQARHNGDKMMNELYLPLRQWPIGTHIDYQEDVSLKKKKAGRLYLGIDVVEEDEPQPKQRDVKVAPAHVPTPVETETEEPTLSMHETETITESQHPEMTMTETETVQSRDAVLDEPSNEYCDFTWGNYDSYYSTRFSGFTENSSTMSELHSTEERFHHHHRLHPETTN